MSKSPETMNYKERLKVARKWAREKGGILKQQNIKINGTPAYCVVDDIGQVIMENWTLYSIACDAIYA